MGSSVARPQFKRTYIAVTIPLLRKLLFTAYSLLYFSVAFFMSTFIIAGYIVFPDLKGGYNVSIVIACVSSIAVAMTAVFLVQPAVLIRYFFFNFLILCFMLVVFGGILAHI
jgi:hypothetical protein